MNIAAYKSPKIEDLYLFVPEETALDQLPNELLVMFGEPKHVINFELSPEKKLAQEDPKVVLEAIQTKGYFVQLPPKEKEKFSDMPPPPPHLDNIF